MKVLLLAFAFALVAASALTITAEDNNIRDFIQDKYCNNGNG